MATKRLTFRGPPLDDFDFLRSLPDGIQGLLRENNGFILHDGAFHLRGVCDHPNWHSLRHAWTGDHSFSRLYATVTTSDIPFAEDAFGDQFLWRDGRVLRLFSETGLLDQVAKSLGEFLHQIDTQTMEYLNFNPEMKLEPGMLWHVYPPFVCNSLTPNRSFKAVPTVELRAFNANLAEQLKDLPDGTKIEYKMID